MGDEQISGINTQIDRDVIEQNAEAFEIVETLILLTWQTLPTYHELPLLVTCRLIDKVLIGTLAFLGTFIPTGTVISKVVAHVLLCCLAGFSAILWIVTLTSAAYWIHRAHLFAKSLPKGVDLRSSLEERACRHLSTIK